jgi:hypothetical protein
MRKLEFHNCQRTGVSTFASPASPSTNQSLQKSFHLSYADKIELKKISSPSENKKYPTAQTIKIKTVKLNKDNGLQRRSDRTPAHNRRLAQWRVTWLIEHSTSHQLLWCIDSFVLRNPPLRQAPKRV